MKNPLKEFKALKTKTENQARHIRKLEIQVAEIKAEVRALRAGIGQRVGQGLDNSAAAEAPQGAATYPAASPAPRASRLALPKNASIATIRAAAVQLEAEGNRLAAQIKDQVARQKRIQQEISHQAAALNKICKN